MRRQMITRVVKIIISVFAGSLVTAGYMTEADMLLIAGGIAAAINTAWTYFQVSRQEKEIEAIKVGKIPEAKPVKERLNT